MTACESNASTASSSIVDIEKQTDLNSPLEGGLKVTDTTLALALTRGRKLAISAILILCNSILFMSFGSTLGGGFAIGKSFGLTSPTTVSWIAASYPLTQGAFVLVSGRIGDVFGHKVTLLLGLIWFILWSLITGFCTSSFILFILARAMSGIGAALVMPNVVAEIGRTFRPGERGRNLSFGFLGFGAPVGGTAGVAVLAVFLELTGGWSWFFFCMAGVGVLLFLALWFVLPKGESEGNGSVDWVGAVLGISALVTFNFVWNQAPAVGWSTLYVIILLFVSLGFFLGFVLWEHKVAEHPILPLSIFTAPSFFPLTLVMLSSIIAYATSIWYMTAWQQILRQWSPLHYAAGLSPHAIAGSFAAPLAAFLVSRIAAQWLLAFGSVTVLLSCILLATMPEQQSYWVQVFPATILMSLCPDFNYTAAQIITASSVRKSEQGVAGSLIWLIQLYGASIGLGVAGTVEANTKPGEASGYRNSLWFAAGCAILALVVDALFVRVPRDRTEAWKEEAEEQVVGNVRERIVVQCGDAM